MSKELLVDFETGSLNQHGLILSMSFLCADPLIEWDFDDLVKESFTIRLDLNEQSMSGRMKDKETIDWWACQDKKAFNEAWTPKNRIDLKDVTKAISSYLNFHKYDKKNQIWWSRGLMEVFWFQDLCSTTLSFYDSKLKEKENHPLLWFMGRDVRTAIEVLTGTSYSPIKQPPSMIKHIPSHDIAYDFLQLQAAYMDG